ncbi:hypothetical protein U0355_09250 [Salimicrobium sp. PL1-032A]|uniref:hypothetical protein n=1 Tax=Salimicrobium sp. PL1-032A TaxID=3095364 RepID=UPI003260B816
MLRLIGLFLSIMSVAAALFFSLDVAVFIFGTALLLFGYSNFKIKALLNVIVDIS